MGWTGIQRIYLAYYVSGTIRMVLASFFLASILMPMPTEFIAVMGILGFLVGFFGWLVDLIGVLNRNVDPKHGYYYD